MTNRKQSLQFTENDSLQFASRLKALVDSYKSASALAREIGVVEGTIRKWANGLSQPKIGETINLAKALDVNLLWLATGEGPRDKGEENQEAPKEEPPGPLNMERLKQAIEAVDRGLQDHHKVMHPTPKAALVAAVYDLLMDDGEQKAERAKNIIKLMRSAS